MKETFVPAFTIGAILIVSLLIWAANISPVPKGVLKYGVDCNTKMYFAQWGSGLAYIGQSAPVGVPVKDLCDIIYYQDEKSGNCFALLGTGLACVPCSAIETPSLKGEITGEQYMNDMWGGVSK